MSGSGQRWQVLRTCVGFIYPVVKSVQAILSEDMEDDLTWLRYWVVLALVSLVEMAVDPMVDYFPAYLLAKCAFLIWCMAPSPNNGASFVFTQVQSKINTWMPLISNASVNLFQNVGCFSPLQEALHANVPCSRG